MRGRKVDEMATQEDDAVLGNRPVAALHCIDVPATGDRLSPLRQRLSAWAAAVGMSGDRIDAVILATDEAVSNVVSHAYTLARPGTFDLHATHHPDQHQVRVTVHDHGHWQPAERDPGPLHGRGLVLIRALADEAAIEPSAAGTTVRMGWQVA